MAKDSSRPLTPACDTPRPTSEPPALSCSSVTKHFGHVEALRGASLDVTSGRVTALFGDNGAGKSTLLRILCGIHAPDSGTVSVNGEQVQMRSIRDAQARGIDVIHQDLALAPDLTLAENMFLGHEEYVSGWRRFAGVLARNKMADRAVIALRELGVDIPSVRVPVRDLSGGQRQAVAVARAVLWSRTVVLMDEPTAALGTRQSDQVCATISEVARRGLGVLVISHDIPRILEVADTVVVLRRGAVALESSRSEGPTITDVVHAMVGDRE